MAEKIGRREQKKKLSRKAILDAAVQEFRQRGFRDTSIANIMNRAGLGVGTFYNYFETKEEVLMCLLGRLVDEVDRALETGREEKCSSLELLETGCMVTASFLDQNRFVLPLFLTASDHAAMPEDEGKSGKMRSPGFKPVFEVILLQGQEAGEIRKDVPAELIAEMFHSIYQAASFSKLKISFQENVRMKIRLLLDGIRAEKSNT